MILIISNIITFSRIILTPLIIACISWGNWYFPLAGIFFLAASITDFFDGYFARKYSTESKLGAFLDPLADKILLLGTFYAFSLINMIPFWAVIVMGIRDIFITTLRIIAKKYSYPFTTSKIAKFKTALQCITLYIFFLLPFINLQPITAHFIIFGILYLTVSFTIWTGIDYLFKNYKLYKSFLRK